LKRLQPLLILLALSLIVTLFPQKSDAASKNSLSIAVNDMVLPDAEAVYRYDMIYVPLRSVFEGLEYELFYNENDKSIQFEIQNNAFTLFIHEDTVLTAGSIYHSQYPFVLIKQRTYIPLAIFEKLLITQVHMDQSNNLLSFQTMNFSNDIHLENLVEAYFTRSTDLIDIFSLDIPPKEVEFYEFRQTVLEKMTDFKVIEIIYESTTDALAVVSYNAETPAVYIEKAYEFSFTNNNGKWRLTGQLEQDEETISVGNYDQLAQTLFESNPDKVKILLDDVAFHYTANYDGEDVAAAMSTYSPKFIERWNKSMPWISFEDQLRMEMGSLPRHELLESKPIYMDDEYAAVYIRIRIHYGDSEEQKPMEHEEIIYLEHTNKNRWTYIDFDVYNN